MSEKRETMQAPLPDLLDHVPDDIVLGIPGDEPMFRSYTNIPIGRLARQAAAELRRQHAEIESLRREQEEDQCAIRVWRRRADQAEAKSDALLEALHAMLSHTAMLDPSQGFDGFDHSAVNQARAAIKAVEEGK